MTVPCAFPVRRSNGALRDMRAAVDERWNNRIGGRPGLLVTDGIGTPLDPGIAERMLRGLHDARGRERQ